MLLNVNEMHCQCCWIEMRWYLSAVEWKKICSVSDAEWKRDAISVLLNGKKMLYQCYWKERRGYLSLAKRKLDFLSVLVVEKRLCSLSVAEWKGDAISVLQKGNQSLCLCWWHKEGSALYVLIMEVMISQCCWMKWRCSLSISEFKCDALSVLLNWEEMSSQCY